MAKIAIVDITFLAFQYNFGAIADLLAENGHTVAAVYPGSDKPRNPDVQHIDCYWQGLWLTNLNAFDPDYVLVFNGSHPHRYTATRYFESRWKVVYAENGWLPQGDNMYLDSKGVGSRSSLHAASLGHVLYANSAETLVGKEAALDHLRHTFEPKPIEGLPKDYILVPLQLENDTSILFDSPWIKSMRVLVEWVRWHFSDHPIVVKPHPKAGTDWSGLSGVHVVDKHLSMNDLVAQAKMVIGVNSTSLIEALVHYKPVIALGYNVASSKQVYVLEPEPGSDMLMKPRGALSTPLNKEATDNVLLWLLRKQFHRKTPPLKILDFFTV